jgi:hypothetical protein
MLTAKSGFASALCVVVGIAAGCSGSTREFHDDSGSAGAGMPSDGGKAFTVGGKSSIAGGSAQGGDPSSSGGTEPSGQAGDDASAAGAAQAGDGAGGGAGTSGNGGSAGKAPTECPGFSCCISGKTFDVNVVSPLNACDVCKPAESTSAWTAADGALCENEKALAVHPKQGIYKGEGCGLMCVTNVKPLTEKVKVSITFGGTPKNPTSSESFLELDFSNLIPADTLSVTHASLRLYADPYAPTAELRSIVVKRVGALNNSCLVTLPDSAGFTMIECDVTADVQSWLASPPGSVRSLKIGSGPADHPADVLTPVAADGTQRPVLLLDYSGKCAGNVCPKLVGN